MLRLALAALLALFVGADKGDAHEFWISPETYRAAVGDAVQADLRVGEEFRGAAQSYVPRNFTLRGRHARGTCSPSRADRRPSRAECRGSSRRPGRHRPRDHAPRPHLGRLGPVRRLCRAQGPWRCRHDAGGARARPDRRARGYFRYAKSLIAIGHGHGQMSWSVSGRSSWRSPILIPTTLPVHFPCSSGSTVSRAGPRRSRSRPTGRRWRRGADALRDGRQRHRRDLGGSREWNTS
jgi:hypothetical protein